MRPVSGGDANGFGIRCEIGIASRHEGTRIRLPLPKLILEAARSPSSARRGINSMSSIDRRREVRVSLRVPLKFRPVTDPPSGERNAETVNLSQRGLFFSTDVPLCVGSQVEVFMKMPTEISGKSPAEVRCVGRVVHIRPGTLFGKSGVGIRIERYEVLTARERWAS